MGPPPSKDLLGILSDLNCGIFRLRPLLKQAAAVLSHLPTSILPRVETSLPLPQRNMRGICPGVAERGEHRLPNGMLVTCDESSDEVSDATVKR